MQDDVEARVKGLVMDLLELEDDDFNLDDQFEADLGCDSLDEVEMLISAEESFGIQILDSEADQVRTVRDAVELVKRKVAQ